MFSSKPINRHYLFTISYEGKIVNLENLLTQFLFDLKRNAKQAHDTRGVTTNPPKKNLIPRFRARIRKGENTILLLSRDYSRRLHDFETKALRDLEASRLRTTDTTHNLSRNR
jgi:hypothetical protein